MKRTGSGGGAPKYSPARAQGTLAKTAIIEAMYVRAVMRPNENKMSDGGRNRASLGVNGTDCQAVT